MREHNKRWLISRLKTSGSKRERVQNGRYADERHLQNQNDWEDLPSHEAMKHTQKFYNGKINYGLLVRFLRGQVGRDWSQVYSEIIIRIPTKLLPYKDMVYWFVANQVEFREGKLWNRKTQQFIWTGGTFGPVHHINVKEAPQMIEFYVHPETNLLVQVPQKAFKRVYKR